jgi:hypothetical protein
MASERDAKQSGAQGAGRALRMQESPPGKQTRVEQLDAGQAQQRPKESRNEVPRGEEDRAAVPLGEFGISAWLLPLGQQTYTDGNMEVTVTASASASLTLSPSVKVDPNNFRMKSGARNIVDAVVTLNFDDHGRSIDMQAFSIKHGHLKMSEGVSPNGEGASATFTLSGVVPARGHEAGLPGRHGYVKVNGEVSFDLKYSIKFTGPPPPKPFQIPSVSPAWQATLSKAANDAAETLKKATPGLLGAATGALGACIASGVCEAALLVF